MTMEIWKDVLGYEGFYEVSNLGRVKSLPRVWYAGNTKALRRKGETIMKLYIDGGGYCQVDFSINCKHKRYSVHRVVASAFIDNPENKPCVNHINSDRTDNRVENLEWVTYHENTKHAFKYGNMKKNKGIIHGMCRLTEEDVLKIRELEDVHPHETLAKMFNTGRRNVGYILSRKLWKHI